MKMICIKNWSINSRYHYQPYITIGKIYDIYEKGFYYELSDKDILICDDRGDVGPYKKEFFQDIESYRDEKINQILC